MANAGRVFGGLAQGAAAGSAFGLVGAGVGAAIGGIASLFGKSPEEEMQERIDGLVKKYRETKAQNQTRIFDRTRGDVADVQQGVARRMAATGLSGANSDTYLNPATQSVFERQNDMLSRNAEWADNAIAGAEAGILSAPYEPDLPDYLMQAMGVAGQYAAQRNALDAMQMNQSSPSVAPVPLKSLYPSAGNISPAVVPKPYTTITPAITPIRKPQFTFDSEPIDLWG